MLKIFTNILALFDDDYFNEEEDINIKYADYLE